MMVLYLNLLYNKDFYKGTTLYMYEQLHCVHDSLDNTEPDKDSS